MEVASVATDVCRLDVLKTQSFAELQNLWIYGGESLAGVRGREILGTARRHKSVSPPQVHTKSWTSLIFQYMRSKFCLTNNRSDGVAGYLVSLTSNGLNG